MSDKSTKIRVAILCRGYHFDQWEAECIRQVKELSFVEIVLLISEPPTKEFSKGFIHKLKNYPYRNFLWRFFKRYRLKINSYNSVSLEKELKNVPLVECAPELKGKYSQHFSNADLRKIKSYQPDVILRFAYNILRGEILTIAKYGVWSFHHADEQIIRGGPAAFWEIYNSQAVTSAILQRLTEKLDAGIILRKGFFPTLRHSYKGNLEQLLSGTTSWMKQALIDVKNEISPSLNGEPIQTTAKIYSFPKNFQMISFKWKIRKHKIKFHFAELFRPEQWTVGIVNQSVEEIISSGIKNVEWLPTRKSNEYYADPFGWENEKGELQIVAEDYSYNTRKGEISIIKGEVKKNIIPSPFHQSYPFVNKTNQVVSITPECFQSRKLISYAISHLNAPNVLLNDFAAVDSSSIFFEGKKWHFITKAGDRSNIELHIFYINEQGALVPHQNNPVKCDARSSRPGGTPFILDGKLYRPAQDCSTAYGAAVVVNEITELTEISFSEKVVKRIEPNKKWKFNKGLHTFSLVGENYVLIDAKRYKFNFDNFTHVVARKIKRLHKK